MDGDRGIFNCTEFGVIKIGIIEHFPFSEIFNGAFKAQPTENYMLLHLAASHVCQADIILLVVFYNCYFGILNCDLYHCFRYGVYANTQSYTFSLTSSVFP